MGIWQQLRLDVQISLNFGSYTRKKHLSRQNSRTLLDLQSKPWMGDSSQFSPLTTLSEQLGPNSWVSSVFGTRDLFNISYSRELYLFSKFLHFEEIVRVKMAVCFEMIVSET